MHVPCDPSTTTFASIEVDAFFGGDNEDIVSSSIGSSGSLSAQEFKQREQHQIHVTQEIKVLADSTHSKLRP